MAEWLPAVIFVLILLIFSGFFAGSETALMSLSKPKLHAKTEAGDKLAKLLNNMVNKPESLLSTILLGNNLVNIAASAITTGLFLTLFGEAGIAIATLVMTVVVLIFADILPKSAAARYPDTFSNVVAYPMRLVIWLLYPATWVLSKISRFLLRLIGINPDKETPIDEDDIRGAVALGLQHGAYAKHEHRMLDSIFDLDDLTVADVMVHRQHMDTLDVNTPFIELRQAVANSSHTRLPVWEDSPDSIIGILHAKDFLRALNERTAEEIQLRKILRKPYFVPNTTNIGHQLREFQQLGLHIAVVVDEYGDVLGLLTLEDILEEIVGEITDEHDREQKQIFPMNDGSYVVNAQLSVRDINRDLEWQLPDDHDNVTLAGLLLEHHGDLPTVQTEMLIDGYRCRVLTVKNNAITRVRVTAPAANSESTNA